jgi:CTP-dependent riboflavin kinase
MMRMTGVIFSDLGAASSFMALDWVQNALRDALGFTAFPATLNVRPKDAADAETWRRERAEFPGLRLERIPSGFCSARLYPIHVGRDPARKEQIVRGAVLVPEIDNYPGDKLEIVAPMRLKDEFRVGDGDELTLEFLN